MSSLETSTPDSLELHWQGPFRWPGVALDGEGRSLDEAGVASRGGIYLWTVEHGNGFLIYAAGITRRPFPQRFREHTRYCRSGVYTVFDMSALKQGLRNEIWHGFWFTKRLPEKQKEYNRRQEEIRLAAEEQLRHFHVFVAAVDPVPRGYWNASKRRLWMPCMHQQDRSLLSRTVA